MNFKRNSKCKFCLKSFQTSEYLRAHYKKRHAHDYARDGLENEENIQLMANLLTAADKAGHKKA